MASLSWLRFSSPPDRQYGSCRKMVMLSIHARLCFVIIALALAVALGLIAAVGGGWHVLWSLGGLLAALGLSRALGQPKTVQNLVLLAWAVRSLLMALLKLHSFDAGLSGFYPGDADARAYHTWALRALSSQDWRETLHGMPPYTMVVTGAYRLFGPHLSVPQLINLSLAVLVVPLLYQVGRRVGGRSGAMFSVLVWAVAPSGLLWSVSLLKDTLVVTGVVLSVFLLLALAAGTAHAGYYAAGVSGVALLFFIRPQYVLSVVLALMLAFLLGRRDRARSRGARLLVTLAIAAAVAGVAASGTALEALVAATSDEGATHAANVALAGGSGIAFVTRFPPAVRWIAQLPFAMFAPFPWQWLSARSAFAVLAGAENLLWYFVYFRVWKARRRIRSDSGALILTLFAFSIFVAVSFGLPNVGSMYRYRWAGLVLLLPLVRLGTRRASRRQQHDAAAGAWLDWQLATSGRR